MMTRKLSVTLVVSIGLVVVAAGPHYRRTKPQLLCTIPDRDYQFKEYSQPKRAVSAVGLPLRSAIMDTSGKARKPAIQAFQFVENPVLQIDHCSLSKMSVLLHENGHWTVSFQADQNPASGLHELKQVTTAEEQRKITTHILRNQFEVRVTCYGQNKTATETKLGKAIVVPLDLKEFWVQKSIPYPYYDTGYDGRIKDNFDLIDRVEIEFAYRLN